MSDKSKVVIELEKVQRAVRTISQLQHDIHNGRSLNNSWVSSIENVQEVLEALLVGADTIKIK